MNNQTATQDPLAHASERPDVSALIDEFQFAMQNGVAKPEDLAGAEDVRYNRWPGKSPSKDGCRWQENAQQGDIVRPYDGRPDTDVNLADEIITTETDFDLTAFNNAQVGARTTHISALTAAQIAELTALVRWIRTVTADDTADGAELLSQMKATLGWAIINTGWKERWSLVERTVTMEEVMQIAQLAQQQLAQQSSTLNPQPSTELETAAQLPILIMDPELQDMAVEAVRLFAPEHLTKQQLRGIITDLRAEGTATFLDRQLEEKRPTIKVLIPGVDIFFSGNGKLQEKRGALRIEFFYQAQLEAMQLDAGWNEEFIQAAIGTMGQFSSYSGVLRNQSTPGDFIDAQDKRIEIWTTEVKQFDPDTGAMGIYCTTFSPHLKPGTGSATSDKSFYAKHYLLAWAHGQYPYVACRREVIGPDLEQSRGVPEMVRADSNVIKLQQDALGVRSQWEVNPATVRTGAGWTKIKTQIAPGADVAVTSGDLKSFAPDKGNPQVGLAFMQHVEARSKRRFALPSSNPEEGHPMLWQMRQGRATRRTLNAWEGAYWQLAVICYQEMDPAELGEIIGRPPLLNVTTLLRHRISLHFDVRGLDNDWRKDTLDTFIQMLSIDNGGLLDRAPLLRAIGNMTDPVLMDEVMRDPAGASAQLYRKVEQDVTSIMLGNPPPMVEMDPTAGMQLKFAFSVLQQNQDYQKRLQGDPQVQENFKTYAQNLQHSEQETQISPVQGRLGVAQTPNRPVQQGAPQLSAGGQY